MGIMEVYEEEQREISIRNLDHLRLVLPRSQRQEIDTPPPTVHWIFASFFAIHVFTLTGTAEQVSGMKPLT